MSLPRCIAYSLEMRLYIDEFMSSLVDSLDLATEM
jgi:hypothetical protein